MFNSMFNSQFSKVVLLYYYYYYFRTCGSMAGSGLGGGMGAGTPGCTARRAATRQTGGGSTSTLGEVPPGLEDINIFDVQLSIFNF